MNIIEEKKYISKKLGLAYASLSQAEIRSETQMISDSVVRFQLQKGKGNRATEVVTERLLELNDSFVVTHFRVSLKQIAADVPTNAQHLTTQLQTYEDPNIFKLANAANVGAIYNGSLKWTISRTEFLPQFPMNAFRRVPQTQTGVDVDWIASGNDTTNEYPNGLYAFYPCEPIIINGKHTIDLLIELGETINFDDASNSVWAVFEARGYLLTNSDDK